MKRSLALALVLALLCFALAGCDPCALLYGTWSTDDDSLQYAFGTDGKGYANYMQFPIEFTYTYVDGVLTISYSEEIQEVGKVTFFGDYEFTLETQDEDGNLTQETYYKQVSDS